VLNSAVDAFGIIAENPRITLLFVEFGGYWIVIFTEAVRRSDKLHVPSDAEVVLTSVGRICIVLLKIGVTSVAVIIAPDIAVSDTSLTVPDTVQSAITSLSLSHYRER
jgi:hypothetical protein